ncbi:hypothetical protein CHISP_0503 [Chitinispirillum alkaliphilum]|nr:hypothetical protein CHISP_0503 [Chitinispirillum alkaliphilum]
MLMIPSSVGSRAIFPKPEGEYKKGRAEKRNLLYWITTQN